MPPIRWPIVQVVSTWAVPVTLLPLLIHWTTPSAMVPMPRVTMNESTPISTTRPPLITPIITEMKTANRIAGRIAQWCWVFSTAMIIALSDMLEAIERSKSPVVSTMIRPSASTSRTACEPKMVWKLPDVG